MHRIFVYIIPKIFHLTPSIDNQNSFQRKKDQPELSRACTKKVFEILTDFIEYGLPGTLAAE